MFNFLNNGASQNCGLWKLMHLLIPVMCFVFEINEAVRGTLFCVTKMLLLLLSSPSTCRLCGRTLLSTIGFCLHNHFLHFLHAQETHNTPNLPTYSSPNLLISNSPAPIPTSSSFNSSVLLTIVAPHARAILLLSVFLTLLIAVILAFIRKCWARSENKKIYF